MKKHDKSKFTNLFIIALSIIYSPAIFAAENAGASQPILFRTNRDGNFEIYKMSADGTNQERLTNSSESESRAFWSPNGAQILFQKVISSTQAQIWTMNADGTNQTMVSDATGYNTSGTWSANGGKILFTKGTTLNNNQKIWIMNADGSNKLQLTSNTTSSDILAAWSPDGNKIAFTRCYSTDSNCDIWTMNANGMNQINLTPTNPNEDALPLWTPDGRIVYSADNASNIFNVYVMNADGTNKQPLTNFSSAFSAGADKISPDGSKVSIDLINTASFIGDVATVNLDGSNFTNLTNHPADDTPNIWSADGTKLVFNSTRDATSGEIYTMNADGSGVVRLTNNTAADSASDWFRPTVPNRAVYDFDGDGRTDISVARNGSDNSAKLWYVQRSSDNGVTVQNWGLTTDIITPGDYDGDSKTDLAIRRTLDPQTNTQAYYYILQSSTNTLRIIPWGLGFDNPEIVEDFDGDGKDDPCAIRQTNDNKYVWYIRRSTDNQYQVMYWGNNSLADYPVGGDYDGDGKNDAAVYRASTNTFYILQSSNGQAKIQQWGNSATDYLVPADYDGDGKTDIAVWRGVGENADNGFWYILQSSTGIVRTQKWGIGNQGISGDVPVPGDYDGDGKTDLAVVRQGNPSVWYVLRSSNNSFFAVPFGASNFFDEYLPILKTR